MCSSYQRGCQVYYSSKTTLIMMTKEDVLGMLEGYYVQAERELVNNVLQLPEESVCPSVDLILQRSEASKGVLTVVLTSLVYKLLCPKQDIRKHQSSIFEGYSGRTFDSQYITPYLKSKKFPSMAESGWLTRSLEQKVPYDYEYTGAIKPQELKGAFLDTIHYIQHSRPVQLQILLRYLFGCLIRQRERNQIHLATPNNLTIAQTLELVKQHWDGTYKYEGAARLPVLAIYAVYEVFMKEIKRFEAKTLLPLENHTSSDRQSGRLGDIDVVDNGVPFEAVEIKHHIPITLDQVEVAYEKFISTSIKRYYILSSSEIKPDEQRKIDERIMEIKNIHGCHLIVNGLFTTLKYYLRLLDSPTSFIERYTTALERDTSIKYEHKVRWNELVQNLLR